MYRKLFCLGIVLLTCTGAGAVMVPLTTADLTGHATLVITGTVEGVKSLPPDGRNVIYSEAEVRVGDTVIGAPAGDRVTVRYMGGTYGDLGYVVEDQPTFKAGEQVVLFLAPAAGGAYACPDGVQGKLNVVDGTVLPAGVTLNHFLADVTAADGR